MARTPAPRDGRPPDRWLYPKEGGDRWPVQPGETWAVGPHRLICGDLTREGGQALLQRRRELAHQPCLIYCDPPWNLGNVNSFHTKAGVAHTSDPFPVFLGHLCRVIVKLSPTVAFIEMGVTTVKDLHRALRQAGMAVAQEWPITYYRTKPCTLTCAVKNNPAGAFGFHTFNVDGQPLDLAGMDDDHTPAATLGAILPHPGDDTSYLIIDPCAGRGLVAVTAHNLHHQFMGLELSPARASVTLTKLQQLTGLQPERTS